MWELSRPSKNASQRLLTLDSEFMLLFFCMPFSYSERTWTFPPELQFFFTVPIRFNLALFSTTSTLCYTFRRHEIRHTFSVIDLRKLAFSQSLELSDLHVQQFG
jgi:hypothetical protein